MIKRLFSFVLAAYMASAVPAAGFDYSDGFFIVNEDWFGHQNSTVNFIRPDAADGEYWQYRVFQTENPGCELGCTTQFGAIWNGRFYFISKQARDGGSTVTGGRITVADAKTLKVIRQLENIAPDGAQCDGRGFVGVSNSKGYVSSSNGIWVLDLNTITVTGMVKDSSNPNTGDDKPVTDPSGSLYHGQCGTMVMAGGYVFAAHQSYGVIVIDTEKDEVIKVIDTGLVQENSGIGAVVLAYDGMVYGSIAGGTDGRGSSLPFLLRINPKNLETSVISLPDGCFGPANSWYAWTPDGFFASENENKLYWHGGPTSWFANQNIYCYDIDSDSCSMIIDLSKDPDNWQVYGCSIRMDPSSEDIYMSVFHTFQDPTYVLRRYSCTGELLKEYPMVSNYWFPSLPVFPKGKATGIGLPTVGDTGAPAVLYDLQGRPAVRTNARSGIYIERRGTKVRKIIIR